MQPRFLGMVALTAVLGAVSFVGLRAATAEHEVNPPANVKMMPGSYAGSHHGYSAVIKQVLPAVVSVRSSKMVKQTSMNGMNPEDLFRFFGGADPFGGDQQPGQQGARRQFNVPNAPQERRESGLGSGVIVSPEGYILTNNHVVDGATEVVVTLHDRREFKARVVGTDKNTDIAVVKIDGSNFPVLTFADSDKVEIGDIVLAIGNPFGVGQTVTQGIVSATGRVSADRSRRLRISSKPTPPSTLATPVERWSMTKAI